MIQIIRDIVEDPIPNDSIVFYTHKFKLKFSVNFTMSYLRSLSMSKIYDKPQFTICGEQHEVFLQ